MGIDYSYDIYIHRDRAAGLLAGIAALGSPQNPEQTTVVLPDGSTMRIPGSFHFRPEQTVALADLVSGARSGSFDLAVHLPADDEPLRAYRESGVAAGWDPLVAWADGTERVRIALVYLSVYDGSALLPDHWLFSLMPAVTRQSRVFLRSPTVRRTFATLALDAGSPLCLLDVELPYDIVVAAAGCEIAVDVPGPVRLWNRFGPKPEVYRELLGEPAPEPMWIVGPGHPQYAAFIDELEAATNRVS